MTPKQLANILVEDIKPGSWGIINEAIQYNYIIITKGGKYSSGNLKTLHSYLQQYKRELTQLESGILHPQAGQIDSTKERIIELEQRIQSAELELKEKNTISREPKQIGAHAIHDSGKNFLYVGILPGRAVDGHYNRLRNQPPGWVTFDNSEFNNILTKIRTIIASKADAAVKQIMQEPVQPEVDEYLPDTDEWGRNYDGDDYERIAKMIGGVDPKIIENDEELKILVDSIPRNGVFKYKYGTILTINKSNIADIKKVGT